MSLISILEENARLFSESPAIIDSSSKRIFTYREFVDRIDMVAGNLASRGVKRGDRVALYLPNCSEFIISFFAILKLGAIAVPFNTQLKQYEVKQLLDHSRPKMLIGQALVVDREVTPILNEVPYLLTIVKVGSNVKAPDVKFADLLVEHDGFYTSTPTDDQPAAIYYTSGTTGQMKGVLLTHKNLAVMAHINGHYLLGLNDQDRVLGISPYCHVYFFQVVLGPLCLGAAVVTLERLSPKLALETIEKYRVTHVSTVPTMFRYLLRQYRKRKYDLSSWRIAGSAATNIPSDLVRELEQTFQVDFFDTYGCTETGSTITYTRLRHYKPGSVGLPAHGIKVKVIDDHENEVATGEVGEIAVKSPGVFTGYWRDSEKTLGSFTGDDWFKTGDLGFKDKEGYFYLVGRKKDVIVSGGYNIYPWEIEHLLISYQPIADAAVIGRADDDLGEIPVAYIVVKSGYQVDAQTISDYCLKNLAKYKCPRDIVFMDTLPRNSSGKLVKRLLK